VHRRRHSVTVVEVKYAGGGGFVPFTRDKHTHRRLLGQVPVSLSGGMASLIDVHEYDSPQVHTLNLLLPWVAPSSAPGCDWGGRGP
jgi:hypothetical protein